MTFAPIIHAFIIDLINRNSLCSLILIGTSGLFMVSVCSEFDLKIRFDLVDFLYNWIGLCETGIWLHFTYKARIWSEWHCHTKIASKSICEGFVVIKESTAKFVQNWSRSHFWLWNIRTVWVISDYTVLSMATQSAWICFIIKVDAGSLLVSWPTLG